MKRIVSLDLVGGILILYMIITHACQKTGYNHNILDVMQHLFFFFMAWFYFKSGMFYKKDKLRACFNKGVDKLIVPFVSFSLLGLFYTFITTSDLYETLYAGIRVLILQGAVVGNLPLWFFPSLFVVKVLYCWFDNKNARWLFFFLCLLLFISLKCLFKYLQFEYAPFIIFNCTMGGCFSIWEIIFKQSSINHYV